MLIRLVKKEHADILLEYLNAEAGVILVFPSAYKEAEELGIEDGDDEYYDFGGEPTLWVEVVISGDQYFFTSIKENRKDETFKP